MEGAKKLQLREDIIIHFICSIISVYFFIFLPVIYSSINITIFYLNELTLT